MIVMFVAIFAFAGSVISVAAVQEWSDFSRGVRFIAYLIVFILFISYQKDPEFYRELFDLYLESRR